MAERNTHSAFNRSESIKKHKKKIKKRGMRRKQLSDETSVSRVRRLGCCGGSCPLAWLVVFRSRERERVLRGCNHRAKEHLASASLYHCHYLRFDPPPLIFSLRLGCCCDSPPDAAHAVSLVFYFYFYFFKQGDAAKAATCFSSFHFSSRHPLDAFSGGSGFVHTHTSHRIIIISSV